MSSLSSFASIIGTTTEGAEVPSLDIKFDDLRNRMESFRIQFDKYLLDNKDKVIDSRNTFNRTISLDKETEKVLISEIDLLHQKDHEIARLRAQEQQELEQSKSDIASYSIKKELMTETQIELNRQIAETRQTIARLKEEQAKQRQRIAKESRLNAPELELWENTLGLQIDGISPDFIKFVFTKIDPNDIEREFYVIMDLRERDYAISECTPQLDQKIIQELLSVLNKSRRLNLFLRDVRKAFKNTI